MYTPTRNCMKCDPNGRKKNKASLQQSVKSEWSFCELLLQGVALELSFTFCD